MDEEQQNLIDLLKIKKHTLEIKYDELEKEFIVIDKSVDKVIGSINEQDASAVLVSHEINNFDNFHKFNETIDETRNDFSDGLEADNKEKDNSNSQAREYLNKLKSMTPEELKKEKATVVFNFFDLGDDLNGNNLSYRDLQLALITGKDLDGIDIPGDTPEERNAEELKQKEYIKEDNYALDERER